MNQPPAILLTKAPWRFVHLFNAVANVF